VIYIYIYIYIILRGCTCFLLQLGGPSWKVGLGRRDSLTANITAANTFIPSPTSNLTALVSSFAVQGLSFKDMVALSGNY
jgi:peroxidase